LSIAKLMSRDLITLELDDDLSKAKAIFDSTSIHHILVTDNGSLVGIITDRDVYKHLSPTIGTSKETPKDIFLLQKKVHLIMSRKLTTINEEITLNESVVLLHDQHVSCLPVVDDKGHPIGIITWRDILKVIALRYKRELKMKA